MPDPLGITPVPARYRPSTLPPPTEVPPPPGITQPAGTPPPAAANAAAHPIDTFVPAPAEPPAEEDGPLFNFGKEGSSLWLTGEVGLVVEGKKTWNVPIYAGTDSGLTSPLAGTLGLLTAWRAETDFTPESLKDVPVLGQLLTGTTRIVDLGFEAGVEKGSPDTAFDWKGTVTHTFADMPLFGSKAEGFNPTLSISGYAGHGRGPGDYDLFLAPALDQYGVVAWEKATGLYVQAGHEENQDNSPWKKSNLLRFGWMTALGTPPEGEPPIKSVDTVWENSKFVAYGYLRKGENFDGPVNESWMLPDGFSMDSEEWGFGAFVEYHIDSNPFKHELLDLIMGDQRLLAGAEVRSYKFPDAKGFAPGDSDFWIVPVVSLEKSFGRSKYGEVSFKTYAEYAPRLVAGDGGYDWKRALTVGFTLGYAP